MNAPFFLYYLLYPITSFLFAVLVLTELPLTVVHHMLMAFYLGSVRPSALLSSFLGYICSPL